MRWTELFAAYPAQWLVVEAFDAKDAVTERRWGVFDQVEVFELCADGRAAMHRYKELRYQYPDRTFCLLHTAYPRLSFEDDDRRGRVASNDNGAHP